MAIYGLPPCATVGIPDRNKQDVPIERIQKQKALKAAKDKTAKKDKANG